MKKYVSVIFIILMLTLTACGGKGEGSSDNAAMLENGVWPQNEYTEKLPVPGGTVDWAILDTEPGSCSLSLSDISESEYNSWMKQLEQAGFSLIESRSEEVKGQDYVSVNTLVSDGEKSLSISYIPNQLTIYISFAK